MRCKQASGDIFDYSSGKKGRTVMKYLYRWILLNINVVLLIALYPYHDRSFFSSCDQGFGGPHCDPIQPLPMMLRDDFNGEVLNNRNWKEIYGGEPSDICGIVVSGNSLLFHKVI